MQFNRSMSIILFAVAAGLSYKIHLFNRESLALTQAISNLKIGNAQRVDNTHAPVVFVESFPKTPNVNTFSSELILLAESFQTLRIVALTSQLERPTERRLSRLSIVIKVEGGYTDCRLWMHQILAKHQSVAIKSVEFTPASNASTMTAKIVFMVYGSPAVAS